MSSCLHQEYPCCVHYLPVSHLVAILVIKVVAMASQCLCVSLHLFFLTVAPRFKRWLGYARGIYRMIPTSKEVKVFGKETQSCMLRVLHPGLEDTFYSGRSQEEKCSCDFVMLFQRPAHVGLALYGQGPALSVASGVLWGVRNTSSMCMYVGLMCV